MRKYSFYAMYVQPWWPGLKCYILNKVSWYCSYCGKRHRYNVVQYLVDTPRFGLVKCHEVCARERKWGTNQELVCSRGAEYVEEHKPRESDEWL